MRKSQLQLWAIGLFFLMYAVPLLYAKIQVGEIKAYNKFESIEKRFYEKGDSVYVVNFWATWCSPCVAELPVFNAVAKIYRNQPLKILLVSLDMRDSLEKNVIPLVKKMELIPEVILLDDPDFDSWISKVAADWEGAIPGTLVYNSKQRTFYKYPLNQTQLTHIIATALSNRK